MGGMEDDDTVRTWNLWQIMWCQEIRGPALLWSYAAFRVGPQWTKKSQEPQFDIPPTQLMSNSSSRLKQWQMTVSKTLKKKSMVTSADLELGQVFLITDIEATYRIQKDKKHGRLYNSDDGS